MAAIPVPVAGDPTAQSWAAAVANKLNAFGFTTFSGTTDSWGYIKIPAANFGLSVVSFGVASITNTTNQPDKTNVVGDVHAETGVLAVRCWFVDQATNDATPLPNTANVTIAAFAWGTP